MIPNKPSHVRWTNDQWEAIYHTGENVLVSAGAGSGKTAVLTERVIELVKNGTDINRLLVVTFTKAAALEMKERIRERLLKEISEGNHTLFEQLSLLDVANISTFDSFSLFVVKKYAHILKMSPSINIGDTIVLDKLKNDLLDTLINEQFEKKDPDFYAFTRLYSKKNSRNIKSMILSLTENLLKNPDFEAILETPLDHFQTKTYYETIKDRLNQELDGFKNTIKGTLEALMALFKMGDKRAYILEIQESLKPLLLSHDIDETISILNDYSMPRLPSKLFEEDDKMELDLLREVIKETLEEIKKIAPEPFDAFIEMHQSHFKFQKTLKSLTKRFLKRYLKTQIEKGIFDFQTMAYLSTDVLRKNPNVLNELKANYDHIMVDEYQDTNPLQDRFIEMLGNDNLYLVGDIKQSIYRFRDASPELFQEKYERYLKGKGKVIHLNQNFRSRHEVINAINKVFEKTFTKNVGGIDYDKTQALDFGLKPYLEHRVESQEYGLKIEMYSETQIEEYKDLWPYKTNKSKTSATVEASFMIEDIHKKISDGYQVFDKETNALRDVRFDDFMILIDRKSYFEDYQALFQNANIPLFIHKQESFINHEDILVIVSLFKLYLSLTSKEMAKTHFKYAFLSVTYSYISDASQNEIVSFLDKLQHLNPEAIFKASKGTVFESLLNVFETLIKEKDKLNYSDALIYFNDELNLLDRALTLDNVSDIEERFLFIIERLRSFEKSGATLKEVVDYFEYTIKNNNPNNWMFSVDIDYVKGTMIAKDHVNLMTIHKSKGLEFPIVYYPQLFSSTKSSLDSDVFFDQDLGIVMPFMLRGKEKTLLHVLKEKDAYKKDLSERLRVFYVALTRARELMVTYHQNQKSLMPSTVYKDLDKIPENLMMAMSRFSDLIQAVRPSFKLNTRWLNVLETSFLKKKPVPSLDLDKETMDPSRLYTYDLLTIQKEEIIQKRYSMNALLKADASLEKALELGNELHEWLENLTFHLDIDKQLDTMNASPMIRSVIHAFFNQPLIKSLKNEKVYKELPFMMEEEGTLKRGIIDLIFETDDKMVIIDYKTKTIDKEAYTDQVKGYMRYLETKTNKSVEGYLYSLLDHTLKQV